MSAQLQYPWRPVGELLVDKGLLRADELESALAEQRTSGRRLGEILVARGLLTASELTRVLAEQYGVGLEVDLTVVRTELPAPTANEATAWRPLGRILLDRGLLTNDQLDAALAEQRHSSRRLGELLVDRGLVSGVALASALAEQHGLDPSAADDLRPVATAPTPATTTGPLFEVRKRGVSLYRSENFLEAADFVFDRLADEGSDRRALKIVRVADGREEEVFTYSSDRAAEAADAPDALHRFGFDPVRWTGPPAP